MRIKTMKTILKQSSIFIVTLLMIGCYTIINHPHLTESENSDYEYLHDQEQIDYSYNCTQCHENHDHHYTDYYSFPGEYENYHKWEFYYDVPWWYDYERPISRIGHGNQTNNSNIPPTHTRRSFDRRDSSTPQQPSVSEGRAATPGRLSKQSASSSDSNSSQENQEPEKSTPSKRSVDRRGVGGKMKTKSTENKEE